MRSHDRVLQLISSSRAALEKDEVARAFAASLSSKRLDWRSALGSFAAVRHLAPHTYRPSEHFAGGHCAVCGLREQVKFDIDNLSRLRSEQHRLVQFYNPEYAAFDLSTFDGLDSPPPSPEDIKALRKMLDALVELGATAKLADLEKALRGSFKSNKGQRKYVLEALAIAGVLCPPNLPSYMDRWVGYDERESELQAQHFYAKDSAYPLRHWSGAAGINHEAVDFWFGSLL